jgi:hypothetical protein
MLSTIFYLSMAAAPPIVVSPGSMVLPAHSAELSLNLRTAQPTSCVWALVDGGSGARLGGGAFDGNGTTHHNGSVTGLRTDPATLNNVSVSCAAWPGAALPLLYRSLPDVDGAPFPRVGNLWGNTQGAFSRNLSYAASHVSLWMGVSQWGPAEIGELRRRNRHTIVLGSVNAVEDQGAAGPGAVPERFFLHNASGCVQATCGVADRLQTWPGSYRMDLTRPEVARWKADVMLQLMLLGGGWEGHPNPNTTAPNLAFDGLFVDNVFLTQWAMASGGGLSGHPFVPQHWENGTAWASQAAFDSAWRLGVLESLHLFRAAAPHALLSGHGLDPGLSGEPGLFNGLSIGFDVPEMVEGEKSVDASLQRALQWTTSADEPSPGAVREPSITMLESAPPLQLGYGYGFNAAALANMPPPTRTFAQHYFPNVRFGLAFSLVAGAAFTHELGDSYHGQDWWYDELEHTLGVPLGPAVALSACASPPATDEGGWCIELDAGDRERAAAALAATASPGALPSWWRPGSAKLWVDGASGAAATLAWDSSHRAPAPSPPGGGGAGGANASALVSVTAAAAGAVASSVDLHVDGLTLAAGTRYSLRFWARSSSGGDVSLGVDARRSGGDWRGYGLQGSVSLRGDGAWAAHAVNFTATLGALNATQHPNGTVSDARLSFWLGAEMSDVWIDRVQLTLLPPLVLLREFECGVAALNADGGGSIGAGVGHVRTLRAARGGGGGGGGAVRRLEGAQAPLYQRIVDDLHPSFRTIAGAWAVATVESGYDANKPTSEQAVGPYYHQWAHGLRACAATGAAGGECTAEWGLPVDVAGAYNLSAWWPNATAAPAQWSGAARFSVVRRAAAGGADVVAAATLDQRRTGDQWHAFATAVALEPGDVVQLQCADAGRGCIADALLLESAARFNDGSAVDTVTLDPLDGIVLANGKTCAK